MKSVAIAVLVLCGAAISSAASARTLSAGSPAQAQSRHGGRYDEQIRTKVQHILRSEAKYNNVKAEVEDSVVSLSGSVELDSSRRSLVDRIRRVPHVESVENRLILNPAAMPDKELYVRVERNLDDAGYRALTFRVHEGAVTLEGMVADQHERQQVIDLVRRIDGVKEVDSRLTFASH